MRRLLASLTLFGLLGGCSTLQYPVNERLGAVESETSYDMKQMFRHPGDEELLVVVTFSGGGSRAAALAFGVIEELSRHEIVWRGTRKRLIDEVDLVYGVSGGSIVAAYWSLKGNRILDEFPDHFLERNVQQQLLDEMKSASNLWRLSSPRYGRGELLEKSLDEDLFRGATFGQLATTRAGPFAIISAADLSNGARFDFLQEYFNLLCSDLSSFPLARAVAASSAVPIVFAPITLWNHAGDCPRVLPAVEARLLAARGLGQSRAEQRLRDVANYLDVKEHPYVHLVDGGVADNLALRSILELEGLSKILGSGAKAQWTKNVRKAIFIVVDAGTDSTSRVELSADVPRISEVLAAMTDIPIQRFSAETRYLMQETVEGWRQQARQAGIAENDLPLYVADVSLQNILNVRLRSQLLSLPTTLYLPADQVRLLRDAGADLLRESPEFKRLMAAIGVVPDSLSAPSKNK